MDIHVQSCCFKYLSFKGQTHVTCSHCVWCQTLDEGRIEKTAYITKIMKEIRQLQYCIRLKKSTRITELKIT